MLEIKDLGEAIHKLLHIRAKSDGAHQYQVGGDQQEAVLAAIDKFVSCADIPLLAVRQRKQWHLWRFEQKPGEKKPRQVPYYTCGHRRVGVRGSDADRAALVDFDAALAAFAKGSWNGLGLAFLPGDGLIGPCHMFDPEREPLPEPLGIFYRIGEVGMNLASLQESAVEVGGGPLVMHTL